MSKKTNNVTVEAVAQDHLNDVLSNSAALVAAAATQITSALWLADPGCARHSLRLRKVASCRLTAA